MPHAFEVDCYVEEVLWVTPTVMKIRFVPMKRIDFEPGQFLSVVVPPRPGTEEKPVKRAYSFASSPEQSIRQGYELCVKFVKDGRGSEYLASRKRGDFFKAWAPYGDFEYQGGRSGHNVCFVCTGTGVAPFKSIALSKKFQEHPPEIALCVYGAITREEIIYPGVFEAAGVQTIYALNQEKEAEGIFCGRVTDYLKTLPGDWPWHTTDFYLCGNGMMVADVKKFLMGAHGVRESAIHQESFLAAKPVSTQEPLKIAG